VKKRYGIKQYFVTGIFTVLPLAISVSLVIWILNFAWDKFFSAFVPGVDGLVHYFFPPDTALLLEQWHVHQWTGIVLLLLAILCVGFVARRYIGLTLLRLLDRVVNAIPGLNFIYGTIRQFTSTMDPDSPQHDAFRHAVLVHFNGAYLIGFLTSHTEVKGKKFASVFFPCNQLIQGYNLIVPEKDITTLDMKVDDALKYVISFGMVAPTRFKAIVKRSKARKK
jgi:uncharacterized membrane protein